MADHFEARRTKEGIYAKYFQTLLYLSVVKNRINNYAHMTRVDFLIINDREIWNILH